MGGVQRVGQRRRDTGETAGRVLPPQREEALEQTALRQHLDAAYVQAQRPGAPMAAGFFLEHHDLHAVQPQLGRQHRARRPRPGDDDVDHVNPLDRRRASLRPEAGVPQGAVRRRRQATASTFIAAWPAQVSAATYWRTRPARHGSAPAIGPTPAGSPRS